MRQHTINAPRHTASSIAAERATLRRLRSGIMEQINADLVRVERMIRALDLIDGDADFELNDDDEAEHEGLELGWPNIGSQIRLGTDTIDADMTAPETYGAGFRRCSPDDCEPSLASPEYHSALAVAHPWQHHSPQPPQWARGSTDDREEEHDGREPDVDDEPSLCIFDHDPDRPQVSRNEPGDDREMDDDLEDMRMEDEDSGQPLRMQGGGFGPDAFD